MTGPAGFGIWGGGGGVERREASRETRDPVRLAKMEVISDENPFPKAASLNLPGDSALGVEGTSGHTLPELFPPLAESPFYYI